jgi:hypothetical protein
MDTVPKNKRYAIKRLLDNDNTLVPSDLEKLKIVDLLKMIEDQKMKSKEVIPTKEEYKAKSFFSYFGDDEDN